MSLSNFPDGLTSFGQLVGGIGVMGNVYYVVNTSDTASYNLAMERFGDVVYTDGTPMLHTTIASAYAATTTNRNDVIMIDSVSAHTLAEGLAITKSRIHFVGMDGGNRLEQQGSRIVTTVDAADAYAIKNTGTRNTFENLKVCQSDTNAAALHVWEEGGEGTMFKNCSFIFEVADNLDQTNCYEFVNGCDSGTFLNCTFGSDVLDTSVARAVMVADVVTSGQEFKDNQFHNCVFKIGSDDAGALHFLVLATTDVKFGNLFKDCTFMNSINATMGSVQLTVAVASVSSLVEGNIMFVNPATNAASFATTSDNFIVMGPIGANTTTGVGITPA